MTSPETADRQPIHAACNYCGAAITWATSVNGHAMPLDREPNPDGNVVLSRYTGGMQANVLGTDTKRAGARAAGTPLYLHHRLTCPDAHLWNKPRTSRKRR